MPDSPLQKAPAGLLGAFNLKTLGQNPDIFSSMVMGVADVRDMYLADLASGNSVTGNVTVAGNQVVMPVPNGEIWRVRTIAGFLQISAGTTAADGVRFSLGINSVGVFSLNDRLVASPAAATTVFHAASWLGNGFILLPGSSLTLTNAATLSAASAATLRCFREVIPA